MKKVLFLIAVASVLTACGGGGDSGNGSGTAIGQAPNGGVAGFGDTFISAVYAVVLSSDGNDNVATYDGYDTIVATMPDDTAPDTIPM